MGDEDQELLEKYRDALDTIHWLEQEVLRLKLLLEDKDVIKKTFIIRERHLECFNLALSNLNACIEKISNDRDIDVAAEDLRLVRSSLDEFLGIKHSDDLLGDIFKDFCIGK